MSIGSIIAILVIIGLMAYGLWKRGNLYLLLAIAIIVVFIICAVTSEYVPHVSYSQVFWELGFAPSYLTTGENLHTIITSMFVHANLAHLIFNLIALIFIGTLLESRIGTVRFFAIYFLTGIIATLVFGIAYISAGVFLIGASGAISGILGALGRLYPHQRITMFFGFGILPNMPIYVLVIIFLLIETFLAFMRNDSTAHLAHIVGAVSGFLVAPLIVKLEARRIDVKVHAKGLEPLATTPELRDMLERIRTEDDAEVRKAWLQHFYSRARCPRCNGGLGKKRRYLQCENCGWKTDKLG
jgi:membrane associated rhomboid family serine protease